jgi:outer membrane protein TolC
LIDDLPQEFKDRAKQLSATKLPETLDAMLARALRSNPDILSAEIEVQKAEAALNQTRLKVAHEVSLAFRERELLSELVARYQALVEVMSGPPEVNVKFIEAKQALAKVESQLRYLIGSGTEAKPLPARPPGGAAAVPVRESAMAAKWDEQLAKLVEVDFIEIPLADVAEFFQDSAGIDFVLNEELKERKITLALNRRVPLRSALAAIADKEGLGFVLRDYGILITTDEEAKSMSPTIPEKISVRGGGFF